VFTLSLAVSHPSFFLVAYRPVDFVADYSILESSLVNESASLFIRVATLDVGTAQEVDCG
jgi:hypothetical protein